MNCHHYHRVHPRLRGTHVQPQPPVVAGQAPARKHRDAFPPGTLSPLQVLTAYGYKPGQCRGVPSLKLGIGSLGGGVVQADIENAVQSWGMAMPKITVLAVGGATNDPSDQDSNVENMLDILITAYTWWCLTGTPADITIAFGPNASNGMTLVTNALVASGCKTVSWSWGSAGSSWDPVERATLAQAFAAGITAGTTFFAASGDNSLDDGTDSPSADYPASDPNVWAVGGTRLLLKADGSIASESAWGDGKAGDEGGGGGVDATVLMPPWQVGVVPGNARGVPDSAANADPNSGWQISANGTWTVVGGTSAATPFTAALVAALVRAGGHGCGALLTPELYANRATALRDILVGSNGARCTPGWDEATGLGSPAGTGLAAAFAG